MMRRILLASLLLFTPAAALAQTPDPTWVYEITGTTTLRWTPPTQNVDGSVLEPGDLDSYNIYFGLASRNYSQSISVADGAAENWSFSWPVANETQISWYFAMTALDSDGNESVESNEIVKNVTLTITDTRPPDPPVLDSVETQWNCIIRDSDGEIVPNVSCDITVTDG